MVLLILLVLAWWFFYKKTYYVRIETVGPDLTTQEQIIKTELETTLRHAIEITQNTPYLVEAGNFSNARTIVKAITAKGGVAQIQFSWVWSKPQVGKIQ
ncbi:MAG: hypothetical protein IJQ97_04645 [Paludibacteraceae bacterium]|nr:hypothetical protein [Paludibacteraceae bacterium]